MKNILKSIAMAAFVSFAASCSSELGQIKTSSEAGKIHISIGTSDMLTKADMDHDGNDLLHENNIKSVDFFIYRAAADENEACEYSGHVKFDNKTTREVEFTIDLSEAQFKEIFPTGATKATIYAVVNLPEGQDIAPDASLKDVKGKMLTAEFAESSIQDCFVMSGQADLAATNNGASGKIDVKRIASKLSIALSVKDSYEVEVENGAKETYYLYPELAHVTSFRNCFKSACVDGTTPDAAKLEAFDYPSRAISRVSEGIYAPEQYYTYPAKWVFGDTEEPYFTVTVPYTKTYKATDPSKEHDLKECYYKVILPNNSFVRNCWYDYKIKLEVLGSLDAETPVVIAKNNFFVYDWGGEKPEDDIQTWGNVEDIRYLNIERNDYTAYNLDKIEIPFSTSHECEIVDAWVEYQKLENSSFVTKKVDAKSYITLNGNIIVMNHPLCNDINSSKLDIVPYYFTFRLRHKDDSKTTMKESEMYYEDITIEQTPAIIVSWELNDSKGDGTGTSSWRGNVYVNGQTRNTSNLQYYNSVRTRENSYMYSIQTRVLPDGASYIITDPRRGAGEENMYTNIWGKAHEDKMATTGETLIPEERTVFNPNSTSTAYNSAWPASGTGPSIYPGGNRQMMYYYATQSTEESKNFIAPKFRIASNYSSAGGSTHLTFSHVVERCASYQEAGYPAGRWRLPTNAEIDYVVQLQTLNLIPGIFMPGSGYFSATDELDGTNFKPTTGHSARSLRCVYDDWFWEKMDNGGKVEKDKFTWGDMPRTK